jgi:hypothetical protein
MSVSEPQESHSERRVPIGVVTYYRPAQRTAAAPYVWGDLP